MDANEKKEIIKKKYGEVAMKGSSSCFGGCCSDMNVMDLSKSVGYSEDDIKVVPDANLGLGCGNPTAFAELKAMMSSWTLAQVQVSTLFLPQRR